MLAAMAGILIRDVPDDVRAELARRAARKGQSMQEYLKAALVALVAKPDIDEWVEQVRRHREASGFAGLSVEEIVRVQREERGSV
jgi:antitoxin FitA